MTQGSRLGAIAGAVTALLLLSSTLLPTLSYAQKYANHISNYSGADARTTAIRGFARLYVSPQAAMLPVVLFEAADTSFDALPSNCLVEKHVPSQGPLAFAPEFAWGGMYGSERHPVGLSPAAMPGPPKSVAPITVV